MSQHKVLKFFKFLAHELMLLLEEHTHKFKRPPRRGGEFFIEIELPYNCECGRRPIFTECPLGREKIVKCKHCNIAAGSKLGMWKAVKKWNDYQESKLLEKQHNVKRR